MFDITREIDRDLEVDVLALQALSSPSELLDAELAALGCKTCGLASVVFGCCNNRSNCVGTS